MMNQHQKKQSFISIKHPSIHIFDFGIYIYIYIYNKICNCIRIFDEKKRVQFYVIYYFRPKYENKKIFI
jgi:hypothetical protein